MFSQARWSASGLGALVGFMSGLVPGSLALAQESTRASIEEVVVTAQRRAESMQSVPIAITAFSEDDLESRRIDSLKRLAHAAPGLSMGEFMPTQPQIFIRGIGSADDGPGADPSAAVFIDEVYVGRAAGWTANLFDLERIEVLRGPQGTLYGKNVVGGAINMITRKPDENFRAGINASMGNFDLKEFQGLLSGPISDTLFGKIAFTTKSRDGYMKSLHTQFPAFYPGDDPDPLNRGSNQLTRNTDSVRANLRWLPSDAMEINFSADNAQLDEIAPAFKRKGDLAPDVILMQGLIENFDRRIHRNLHSNPARTYNETTGFSMRVDYDLSWATFTSLSAYRESDTLNTGCCSTPTVRDAALLASSPTARPGMRFTVGQNGNTQDESADQISQEFRLTSAGTGPLEWVGGLYYFEENALRTETYDFGQVATDGAGGFFFTVPQSFGKNAQDAKTESVAAFVQATWSATERLRFTAGTRWSRDEKTVNSRGEPGGLLVREAFDVDVTKTWDEVTPRFVVDYQFTDDLFGYLQAAKGFKSGGFQGTPQFRINAVTPFNPETAWVYEGGIRSDWFERRARANLSVFYTDYADLQVRQSLIPPGSFIVASIVQNAADAEVKGAELELTLLPLEGVTLVASYAYLDATYKNFFAPPGWTTATGVDINQRKGNPLRNAPEHSVSFMSQYESALEGGARLTYMLDWRYQAISYQDPDASRVTAIPAHKLLDARIALLSADARWELSLWVENLLNEDYLAHAFPSAGGAVTTPGAPRMGGLTLSWSM